MSREVASLADLVLRLVLALGAEWAAWTSDAFVVAADLVAGLLLMGLGLTTARRRPSRAAGTLLAASGFAWFAGGLTPALLYLHRGVLIHLVLSYPSGRLRTRLNRVVVAAGYGYCLVYPLARNRVAALAFGLTILLTTLARSRVAGGHAGQARPAALVAAVALALAFGLGAAARLAGTDADRVVLLCYDALIGIAAVCLFADLSWGRSAEGTLTGLVVDLGDVRDAGTLRDRLAWAIGDPSLRT